MIHTNSYKYKVMSIQCLPAIRLSSVGYIRVGGAVGSTVSSLGAANMDGSSNTSSTAAVFTFCTCASVSTRISVLASILDSFSTVVAPSLFSIALVVGGASGLMSTSSGALSTLTPSVVVSLLAN